MTSWKLFCCVISTLAFLSQPAVVPAQQSKAPPPTRQDNVREVIHGVEIVDPYRWLEDQDSPETREWINAQNRFTHSLLGDLPSRAPIRNRLTQLMQIDRLGLPTERNGRYFLWKKQAQNDLWILCFRKGIDGQDEVLIDPHKLSSDHTTNVTQEDVSKDGKLLVYGIRQGGEDETELRVLDVATRQDLADRLPRALYRGVSLKKDNNGFYYSLQKRETGIRIYYHRMGTDPTQDLEIFGKGYGPDTWIQATVSENGRHLLLTAQHGWAKNELYVQNIAAGGPIQPIVNNIDAHFQAQFAGDRLILQTDWKAPKSRIFVVDLRNPSPDKWQEIVPTGADAIEGCLLAGGRVFVHYLHNVTSQIKIFTLQGKPAGEIPLPGLGAADGFSGDWESQEAFFEFSSYTTPPTIYCYRVATGEMKVLVRDKVPFQSERFETRQVWYPSKDGTKIPMFLVDRKGLKLDGKLPLLLHGYGGFNVSLTPEFDSTAALWIEQGGVYAMANLRGGGEFGEAWHRSGMLDNKQNVFDDFIAAAEWLIKNNYTNPSRLAIRGVSNGGLLVGAALTQRPDLFQAVLCEFPDLDMVGYYRFKNNNPPALLEYGNAADPAQFQFLYAYSPYQRVKPGTKYPAVLLTTGDADTRVPPLQARKMTARLQSASAFGKPILLLYDTKAGHSGGKPLSKIIEDLSLEMTFLFWQLGMDMTGRY